MEAKVREYREEQEAERAHDKVYKREIAALKRKAAEAEDGTAMAAARVRARSDASAAALQSRSGAAASPGDNKAVAARELRAENARLSARLRLQMKAEGELSASGGQGAAAARPAKAALQQLAAAAPASKAVKIPAAVLEQADSMVKHKVTTELAQHYESEINADTSFIFSGSRPDETKGEAAAQLAARSGSGAGATTQLAAASPGFGDLHQMEKQVLSQLMEANQRKAQAARERAAAAKKAAARKLALKKRWYQEEVRKEDEAKAKVEAKKAAVEKAAEAKAAAAAAAKYAKAHTPVSKMSVQDRALAFVKAFDGGVASKGVDTSLSAPQAALAGNIDASL